MVPGCQPSLFNILLCDFDFVFLSISLPSIPAFYISASNYDIFKFSFMDFHLQPGPNGDKEKTQQEKKIDERKTLSVCVFDVH